MTVAARPRPPSRVGLCASLAPALLLAGCGDGSPHAGARQISTREMEALLNPPRPISPEPIIESEIGKLKYRSGGCVFSPGNGERGAIALAMTEAGYMKFDGEIVRFAADSGSRVLKDGARSRYVGGTHLFRLAFEPGGGAHITVEDAHRNVVYDVEGKAWCDASPAA